MQKKNTTSSTTATSLALLIDADNTSPDAFPQIMQKVEELGKVTIRRIYGNTETLLSSKWKDFCLHYALQPIHHVGVSGAKNATDIALTVDAMDILLLHREPVTSFCLVTSDQDFTALVLRLRSQGCQVYCIGKPSKADALPKVCTEFISIEQFSKPTALQEETVKEVQREPSSTSQKTTKPEHDVALTELLTNAATKIVTEKKLEWVSVPRLGSGLKLLDAQFKAKTYGYKNLPELVKARDDIFDTRKQGDHLEVRLKKQG